MHIQAFHHKFTSMAELGDLFQALRNLSLVDNFERLFGPGGVITHSEWINWP